LNVASVLLFAVALLAPIFVVAESDRAATQQSLDAACGAARERKLEPERAMYAQECLQQKMKDTLEECQRFYSDYGARVGDRAPLYYDLPECVAAFDYRQSYRE
jgi:hypothetical protein